MGSRPAWREDGDGSLEKLELDFGPQGSCREEESSSAGAHLQKNLKPSSAFPSASFGGQVFWGLGNPLVTFFTAFVGMPLGPKGKLETFTDS